MAIRSNQILAPQFYGPFQIIRHIGPMAYKLRLPPRTLIHPTFHVSLLKKQLGHNERTETILPPVGTDGEVIRYPITLLQRRVFKKQNRAGVEVLVQWAGLPASAATWEDLELLEKQFPCHILTHLSSAPVHILEDKDSFEGIAMSGS